MDTRAIDRAIEVANGVANRAPEYKAETYFAVLVSILLGQSGRALQAGPAPPKPSTRTEEPSPEPGKSYSAAELFASARWETEIEKVALGGRFLERHAGAQRYGLNDIRACLVSAKVPLPANLSLALLKAVQKGWMMEVPGQGEKHKVWSLTQTGERKTEQMLARPEQ